MTELNFYYQDEKMQAVFDADTYKLIGIRNSRRVISPLSNPETKKIWDTVSTGIFARSKVVIEQTEY